MRSMLIAVGDYYHCSDQLLRAGTSIDVPDDVTTECLRYPDLIDPRKLAGYDLLFFAMMGRLRPRESDEHWLDDSSQRALSEHIAQGAGLLVFHSGTASHPERGPFRELVGGHFLHHPPEHPDVTIAPVLDHPITEGVSTFTHPDEHYFLDVDQEVTHLLSARSELGEQSAGWCRMHGEGRVAVIVPGHTREMLEEPMLLRLLSNAARWCLREVP